uniref:Uncharacterized protein n=1 Tax=Kalanchoe fedtschenkoi TaxID=63787 RepID=A0A7N0VHH7_KALFE
MPIDSKPMASLLLFTGVNVLLCWSITPVYDFICFLPYWERKREQRRKEIDAALATKSNST